MRSAGTSSAATVTTSRRSARRLPRPVACDTAPVAVVFKTIKGKGVSFMEDNAGWHGNAPSAEQAAPALAEIDAVGAQLAATVKEA